MVKGSTSRLFLQEAPAGSPPRVAPGELEHALRVLRLRPGDACEGLDGRGHAFPLRVRAAGRRSIELELAGPPRSDPEPGEPDAPLPWIEVAVAWPRKGRAAEMIGRLVQLGAAAITPLVARRSGPEDPTSSDSDRWSRLAREACKQSGRTWLPELNPPLAPDELVSERTGGVIALLDPRDGPSLDTWARSIEPSAGGPGTRARPIVLAIGPEGGFTDEERSVLHVGGATSVRVAPHVLRIETAAEAALAVVVAIQMRT